MLGEGSGWDLRVCPAQEKVPPPAASVNLGVCEFGNLGTWKSGNMEFWNLEIWNLEIWKVGIQTNTKKENSQNQNSCRPKMSARSGLVGKNPPDPFSGHLRPCFPWAGKSKKL